MAFETFLDRRDELPRHRAADDLVLERKAGAGRVRLGNDLDARKLAVAAGLLLVHVVDRGGPGNLLAIGDLRRADIGVDLIGAPEDIDLDVEMQLAHALDDGLAGFLVGMDAERRILGDELGQRDAELLLVGLRLRLDSDLDHRIGEFHLFQDHRLLRIAQRVAGAHLLEARQRHDVAGEGFLDVFAVVGVHQQHAADALFAFLGRVHHAGAAFELARIDAAEGDGADERIVHDLECQQRHRLGIQRLALDLIALEIDTNHRRHVDRRRQVIDHGVEQRLHALVLEGGAAKHRKELAGNGRLANEALERRLVGLLAFEIRGHGVVIELDRGLNQLLAIFLGLIQQLGRNFDVVIFGAERLFVPHHADHAHQIDDALEACLGPDRQLQRHRLGAESIDDVLEALEIIRADLVHLVTEHDARHVITIALPPYRLGLRLHALIGIEHAHRAVEHAQ